MEGCKKVAGGACWRARVAGNESVPGRHDQKCSAKGLVVVVIVPGPLSHCHCPVLTSLCLLSRHILYPFRCNLVSFVMLLIPFIGVSFPSFASSVIQRGGLSAHGSAPLGLGACSGSIQMADVEGTDQMDCGLGFIWTRFSAGSNVGAWDAFHCIVLCLQQRMS